MKVTEQHIRWFIRLHYVVAWIIGAFGPLIGERWTVFEFVLWPVFAVMLGYVTYSRLILPFEGFLAGKIAAVLNYHQR